MSYDANVTYPISSKLFDKQSVFDMLASITGFVTKATTSNITVKVGGSTALAVFSVFFDTVNIEAMGALFGLIICDFFFALWRCYKTTEEVQSKRILHTALKLIVYFALVSAAYMAEIAGLGFVPLDEVVIAFLAVTELISIMESMAAMGYNVPKRLLNKLVDYRDNY